MFKITEHTNLLPSMHQKRCQDKKVQVVAKVAVLMRLECNEALPDLRFFGESNCINYNRSGASTLLVVG